MCNYLFSFFLLLDILYGICVNKTVCHVYYRYITCFVCDIISLLFGFLRVDKAKVLCYIFDIGSRYCLRTMMSYKTYTYLNFTSDKAIIYYLSLVAYTQSECGRSYSNLCTDTVVTGMCCGMILRLLQSVVIILALEIFLVIYFCIINYISLKLWQIQN